MKIILCDTYSFRSYSFSFHPVFFFLFFLLLVLCLPICCMHAHGFAYMYVCADRYLYVYGLLLKLYTRSENTKKNKNEFLPKTFLLSLAHDYCKKNAFYALCLSEYGGTKKIQTNRISLCERRTWKFDRNSWTFCTYNFDVIFFF